MTELTAWPSEKEGNRYRLPTETEWEYCCRAGKSGTRYCFGNDDETLGKYAWYLSNSAGKPHPVGKREANDWDLFDMHGNVWELCQDWYDPNYYKTSPKQDPPGGNSTRPVIRGGFWGAPPRMCRSAYRCRLDTPDIRPRGDTGFRVVCELPR